MLSGESANWRKILTLLQLSSSSSGSSRRSKPSGPADPADPADRGGHPTSPHQMSYIVGRISRSSSESMRTSIIQPLRPCLPFPPPRLYRNLRRCETLKSGPPLRLCRNIGRRDIAEISAAATLPKLGRDDTAEISATATSAAVTLSKSRPPRNCRNPSRRRDFAEIYRYLGRRDGLNP